MWVRGLKHIMLAINIIGAEVAPRVGAWIETIQYLYKPTERPVAPRVGAWIETQFTQYNNKLAKVAPRVGAWIETNKTITAYFEA